MEQSNHYAHMDAIRDSNDPEIMRRYHPTLMPEFLRPNVRLRQHHFLPKKVALVSTQQEYQMYLRNVGDKIEVYWFVKRLLEEHNSCAPLYNYKDMHIETAYLFCMDSAEGSVTCNFFMYIPRSHYRRFLDDVPLLYSTKACIFVDYQRRLAYRFGLCINKLSEETDAHMDAAGSHPSRSSITPSIALGARRRAADELLMEKEHKEPSPRELMATNRLVNMKRYDNPP